MKILENEILVEYSSERQEIVTYRLIENSSEKIIHTVYSLSELRKKGIKEAGRLIGEDILISLKEIREDLIDKE